MNILFLILWGVGFASLMLGFKNRSNFLLFLGNLLNGCACIVSSLWILALISFGLAYHYYRIIEEPDSIEKIVRREIFLIDLKEYKDKLEKER